jgi:hypothetical protein
MSTHMQFGVPMYGRQATGSGLDLLQDELYSACNAKKFANNPNWNKGTHELSEDPFNDCVLKKHNCEKFLKHLDWCVQQYIKGIDDGDQIYQGGPNPTYKIQASWFTKTKKGQHAHMHAHGAADIAGVYYLETNGNDGNLYLKNPLSVLCGSNFILGRTYNDITVPLKTGFLYLWPGFIQHGTAENKTDDDRISLSFNIHFEG